jgi:hypothetical protein
MPAQSIRCFPRLAGSAVVTGNSLATVRDNVETTALRPMGTQLHAELHRLLPGTTSRRGIPRCRDTADNSFALAVLFLCERLGVIAGGNVVRVPAGDTSRQSTLVPYIAPKGSAISSSRAPLGSLK